MEGIKIRELSCKDVSAAVEKLCIQACCILPKEIEESLVDAKEREESPFGEFIIDQILENAACAREQMMPLCQDTGVAIVMVEMGQEMVINGGNLTDAINEGVRRGYKKGFLRKSMVDDPIFNRKNTLTNTPAVIYYELVQGDHMKIMLLPKGGGGENVGALKMLRPADGLEGVKDFVLQTISEAGGKPCPPIIVGVGVGGTLDKAAVMSKKALCRSINQPNPHPQYAALESELLEKINSMGIGPQGLGGRVTALAVQIEYFPTHMASLPVAITVNCHSARFAEITL